MFYADLDNLEHDPKLAEALGNMVVAWASAETAMLNTWACILDIDFNVATAAWYRIPTFEARRKVIQSLLIDWKPTKHDRDAIATAVKKLSNLSRARNNWVHGVWCLNNEKPETVIFDFRAARNRPERRRPVKAADVYNHVKAVRRRTQDLLKLVPIGYERQPSSPKKSA